MRGGEKNKNGIKHSFFLRVKEHEASKKDDKSSCIRLLTRMTMCFPLRGRACYFSEVESRRREMQNVCIILVAM